MISDVLVNGVGIKKEDVEFKDHRIRVINTELLKQNDFNQIDFLFQNTYVDNSAGLHRYIDTDQRVYIFSHGEPFFSNRWFPCFDQPSIRAPIQMRVLSPAEDWYVISNAQTSKIEKIDDISKHDEFKRLSKPIEDKQMTYWLHEFENGPSISSYIQALCAG